MNPRIRCENCIYWEFKIFEESSHDKESTQYARREEVSICKMHMNCGKGLNCGHFVDKETNKSFRDLYFEDKCKCFEEEDPLAIPTFINDSECPIHGKEEE